jgi:crotonobetainyl-CoA:carnitine CoA-transferase CaiB-like acyl-CoA transferase
MTATTGPLAGIRVLDLTRVLAGPYCTQMLGDLGAEVIKIERPGVGDDTRKFAPPYLKDADGKDTGEGAYFLSANRNKRSVAVDIALPEGQAIVKRLILESDVVVENFKTGNLAKYGLGYDDFKHVHKKLVYCSVTGFGQTGPYAERPGYDFLIQGMGGVMSITGDPEGEPQKVGVPIADLFAGMFAGVAICAALRHAAVTGQGQYIDIGMLDVEVAWLSIAAMNYLYGGDLGRLGNAHPNIVPYQPFKCADHYIIVSIGNDTQFARFCEFAGRADLAREKRFATNQERVRNRKILVPMLDAIFAAKPAQHWLDGLESLKIGCGPINNLAQVLSDPHVLARGMLMDMAHPAVDGRPAKMIASPIRLSETPVTYREPPPLLGAHTETVLREVLKMGAPEIERLRGTGALG